MVAHPSAFACAELEDSSGALLFCISVAAVYLFASVLLAVRTTGGLCSLFWIGQVPFLAGAGSFVTALMLRGGGLGEIALWPMVMGPPLLGWFAGMVASARLMRRVGGATLSAGMACVVLLMAATFSGVMAAAFAAEAMGFELN